MMYRAKEATARYMKWDISEEEDVSYSDQVPWRAGVRCDAINGRICSSDSSYQPFCRNVCSQTLPLLGFLQSSPAKEIGHTLCR